MLFVTCRMILNRYGFVRLLVNESNASKCRYSHTYNPWSSDNISSRFLDVDIGDQKLTVSTGQLARFADGSAVVKFGNTSVLVTAVSHSRSGTTLSFLPLTVDYRQKAAAAGRIPTNYLRREMGPTDNEILTSRMIDRSLRPLFPSGFYADTQIMCNLLAVDGVYDPRVISINAASAALALSDIPWNGPVGAVQVGYVDDEVVINPTRKQMQRSSLNLVVTAAEDHKVVMMEASAENLSQQDFQKCVKKGVQWTQHIVRGIKQLQLLYGKTKREFSSTQAVLPGDIQEALVSLASTRITHVFSDSLHHKISRDIAIQEIREDVLSKIKETYPTVDGQLLSESFGSLSKQIFRDLIFSRNTRCDGRSLTDIRPITCQVDLYPPVHGSAMFQRGQTQVLSTVTFDSPDSVAKVDTMSAIVSGIKEKNFFLHYEVSTLPIMSLLQRNKSSHLMQQMKPADQGLLDDERLVTFHPNSHQLNILLPARQNVLTFNGALAEKAIRPVIPNGYPFTIRLTAEVLESNGSSSMASVCGGSLALYDAGVPISEPVAGVAIGLVTRYDPSSNSIVEHRLLTDLLGIEDYMGDMDFKLAGTKGGITALQADIKIPGLPQSIVMEAIQKAFDAKRKIIDIMNTSLSKPRESRKENSPVVEKLEVPVAKRARFFGLGGFNMKKLTADTGVSVTPLDETTFQLFAPSQAAMDEAKDKIEELLTEEREPELEFGAIYSAKIVEIRDQGVLVQLYPTMVPALIHNTQLDQRKISHPSALGFYVGQEISVKYFGRDPASGKMRLSRKAIYSPVSATIKKFSDSV